MNSYLLDTHSFLWSIWQPEKLGQQAVAILENTDHKVLPESEKAAIDWFVKWLKP